MPHASHRSAATLAAVLVAAGSVAAGCSKKPEPKVPTAASSATAAAPAPTTPAAAAARPRNPASQMETGVHIDDAILTACGISAPSAYFAFDSSNLKPEGTEPLEAVARCFATGPLKGRGLKLVGHADPRGESEYNFTLGQARADSVGQFLAGKGLDKGRIASTSRGELDATGTDEGGWSRDRRVDLLLAP